MKIGIIGLPLVGKDLLFKHLTRAKLEVRDHSNLRQARIRVVPALRRTRGAHCGWKATSLWPTAGMSCPSITRVTAGERSE